MSRFVVGPILLLILVLCTALAPCSAEPPLRVAVAGESPFVEDTIVGIDGLSVRVWTNVAAQAGLSFDLVRYPTVQAAVDAVAQGKADVAIGPITLNSKRARVVSFTLPYYSTTLCIGSVPTAPSLFGRVRPLLTMALVFLVGLLTILFLVGNVIWFVERHRNSETFPHTWRHGIGNGMWLAVVTMTGVGYGDAVPVTGLGRIVAATWMLITMLFASTLTGAIASMMTEYRFTKGTIDTPADLAGRRVAVVGGTAVVDYARRCHAVVVETRDVPIAADLLFSGRAEAVLFHTPELRHYVQTHPQHTMVLAPIHEARTDFGFVLGKDSPLVSRLDEELLQLQETGEIRRIDDAWLNDASASPSAARSGQRH